MCCFIAVLAFLGAVDGFDWIWLGLALLLDLSSWFGGGYKNRNRMPGGSASSGTTPA